jgi:hypothetical protein
MVVMTRERRRGMNREALVPMLEAGEEAGCLNLSEFSALIQDLELEDEELENLYQELEERGISLSDDCGRATAGRRDLRQRRPSRPRHRLAAAVPQRSGRYPLLTAAEEVELAKLIERATSRRRTG